MTSRPSDPDGWYDPDTTGAAVLRQIREAGEYRRSDPPLSGEGVTLSQVGTLLALIAELEAERDDWKRQWGRRAQMLDKAEAERDRLKAALEPFAVLTKMEQAKTSIVAEDDLITVVVRIGDIDAARAALSGEGVKT